MDSHWHRIDGIRICVAHPGLFEDEPHLAAALSGDQLKFDLIVTLGELPVVVVTIVSVLDVFEAVALVGA